MKSSEKISLIILISLFIVFSLTTFNGFDHNKIGNRANILEKPSKSITSSNSLKASKSSAKIHISSNSDWLDFKNAGGCTGDGTVANPYVIKDLEIDGGGSSSCIWIEDSDVYFIIENCNLFNAGGNTDDAGIKIINAYNGKLLHNYMHDNAFGMYLDACENITMVGNKLIDNTLLGAKWMFTNHSMMYLNSFQNPINEFYFDFCYLNSYNSQNNITYTYNGNMYESYIGNYHEMVDNPAQDEDGDGILDSPWVVGSHFHDAIMTDYYPMAAPIEDYQYELSPSDLIKSGFVVTNPTKSSELNSGQQYTITWTSYGPIREVVIKLYRGEKPVEIITPSTENDGSFEWTVGAYETGQVYRIYIQDVNNFIVNTMTKFFVIKATVIPGYDLLFIIGLICLATLFLIKRSKNFSSLYS